MSCFIDWILERDAQPEHEDPRPGDIRESLADISRARDIGYKPETSLEGGLADTIAWFFSQVCRK